MSRDVAEHRIDARQHRDHIGQVAAHGHAVEGLQVHEGRHSQLDPVRFFGSVADDVNAQLALGGFDGGVRLTMGENFTVGIDMGTSDETGLPIYIGLGYLY